MGACFAHGIAVRMHAMIVRSFRHRDLRQLFDNDSSRMLEQDLANRARHCGCACHGRDHGGIHPRRDTRKAGSSA